MAPLADQGDLTIRVQGHDGRGTGMADHLQLNPTTIGQYRRLDAEVDNPAFEDGTAGVGAHGVDSGNSM